MGWVEGIAMGSDWYDQQKARERQAALDAQNKQLFDAKMEEIALTKKERELIKKASAPASVSENAPTLDTGSGAKSYAMDNGADVAASDARQFRRDSAATGQEPPLPAVQPGQYSVNDKSYGTQGEMQKAASAYDAPDAKAKRQAQVYETMGNPMASVALLSNQRKSRQEEMQLKQAETEQLNTEANNVIDQEIAAAGGDIWHGLAAVGTKTQLGNLKGATVKAQVSGDGKTMRFMSVNADGSEVPGRSYPNNDYGASMARQDLLKTDAKTKTAWLAERAKTAEEMRKTDSKINLEGAQAEEAKGKGTWYSSDAKTQGKGSTTKMDEEDKVRLSDANKKVSEAEKLLIEATKNVQPGEDATKYPGVQVATKFLSQAKKQQFNLGVELGHITPPMLSAQILSVAKDKQEVFKSLQELRTNAGEAIADDVANEVQNSSEWKTMVKPEVDAKKKAEAAAVKPPAVPKPPAPPKPGSATPMQDLGKGQNLDQFQQMRANNIAAITPLVRQLKQADAAFAAANNSGDMAARAHYRAARDALQKQVDEKAALMFADQGRDVTAQIYAQ